MSALLALSASVKLDLLPSNGLDRSLHLPVMVGLLIMAAFTETLGWSYAGLVVPGYLAAVFAVAPITAVLVIGESILAYLVAHTIGRLMPKSTAWSSLFGRERFMLIILSAVLVRLVVEASVIPWAVNRYGLSHSRELYSIGLVLVPLLANGLWNAGMVAALPRIAVVTGLTYAVIDFVLLSHTNFTVSRFQVANESVSLLFLDTPHAYIILVLGALLAARDNVRYGWDYNGILVPALLAVAWYQPTKLVTTLVEALVVLACTKLVVSFGPLSKVLIVGPRRMVVAYTVGFVLKWMAGMAALRFAPTLQMVDYFGFGYLLPTLLAVKMWGTDRVGSTLVPTVQVALTAFLLGNGIALLMRFVAADSGGDGDRRMFAATTTRPVAFDLMLADAAPAPSSPDPFDVGPTPAQQVIRIVRTLSHGPPDGPAIGATWDTTLRVRRRATGWWTITPVSLEPDDDRIAPRMALHTPVIDHSPWLVVVDAPRVGDPLTVVGEQVAEHLNARAMLVRSRLAGVQPYDDAFVTQLRRVIDIEHVMLIREALEGAELSVVGAVPQGLDVVGLGHGLGSEIALRWRDRGEAAGPYADDAQLKLPPSIIRSAAAEAWGAPEPELWTGRPRFELLARLEELTTVAPGRYRRPDIEELRLFGKSVLPSLLELPPDTIPSAWQRALAARLGYRFASLEQGAIWVLHEPASEERHGNATLVRRVSSEAAPILVEVPAPRWEKGIVDAGVAMFAGRQLDALLMSGSFPSASGKRSSDVRAPAGMRSYYHHAHEVWIQRGGRAVALHGLAEGELAADAIVTFEGQVGDPTAGPDWSRPLVQDWTGMGLSVGSVDGSLERAPYDGMTNPAMAYSRRFGSDQAMLLWLSESVRSTLVRARTDLISAQRLERAEQPPRSDDLAARAMALAACAAGRGRDCPPATSDPACNASELAEAFERYDELRNPHTLRAALSAPSCHVEVVRDTETDYLWVVVAGRGAVRLVPLRTAALFHAKPVVRDLQTLRRITATNLSVVTVEAGP